MKRLRPAQLRVLPHIQALVRGFLQRRRMHRQRPATFSSRLSSRLCTRLDASSMSIQHACLELYDPFPLETWRVRLTRTEIVVAEETLERVERPVDTLEDLQLDDDKQYRIYDDLNRSHFKSQARDTSPYTAVTHILPNRRKATTRLVMDSTSKQFSRFKLQRSHSMNTPKEQETRGESRRKKTKSRLMDSLTPSHHSPYFKRFPKFPRRKREVEIRYIKRLLE